MSRIAHALAKGHEAAAVPNSVIAMVVQDGETNSYDQEVSIPDFFSYLKTGMPLEELKST